MTQQRYYVSCPDCRTRMVRTGKKIKEARSLDGSCLYKVETECPGCGLKCGYSDSRNYIYKRRF